MSECSTAPEGPPLVGASREMDQVALPSNFNRTAKTVRDIRFARYSRINLHDIRVSRAASDSDRAIVAHLRAVGFGRVGSKQAPGGDWLDDYDYRPGVFSLLAHGSCDETLATMRILDGRYTDLEIGRFVPLNAVMEPDDLPATQFARLSVLKSARAIDAMFALFKAALYWCYQERLQTIVIATPPWARHIYEYMFFQCLGERGEFAHAACGGVRHATMKLPVNNVEPIWRDAKSPLCDQFFDTVHPELRI